VHGIAEREHRAGVIPDLSILAGLTMNVTGAGGRCRMDLRVIDLMNRGEFSIRADDEHSRAPRPGDVRLVRDGDAAGSGLRARRGDDIAALRHRWPCRCYAGHVGQTACQTRHSLNGTIIVC
jgi:hypothetical protein